MSRFSVRLRPLSAFFAVCFCLAATLAAHAQTSVYATAGIANYGFTHLYSNSSDTSFKGDTGGFGGGVFYNFPIQSRVTVGVDARFAGSPGYKGGYLGGAALRVGFVPHHVSLRPYFQLGGGIVHASYNTYIASGFGIGTVQESITNGAVQLAFGLDIRLTPHFDLRVPEIGAQAGAGDGVHAGVSFANFGLVYHLRPPRPY